VRFGYCAQAVALETLRLGISCRRKLFKGAAFGRNSSSSESFSVRAGWKITVKRAWQSSFSRGLCLDSM
jgi:hypothetical protein